MLSILYLKLIKERNNKNTDQRKLVQKNKKNKKQNFQSIYINITEVFIRAENTNLFIVMKHQRNKT